MNSYTFTNYIIHKFQILYIVCFPINIHLMADQHYGWSDIMSERVEELELCEKLGTSKLIVSDDQGKHKT